MGDEKHHVNTSGLTEGQQTVTGKLLVLGPEVQQVLGLKRSFYGFELIWLPSSCKYLNINVISTRRWNLNPIMVIRK